jgi:Outer membrane protein beta-barrel domain
VNKNPQSSLVFQKLFRVSPQSMVLAILLVGVILVGASLAAQVEDPKYTFNIGGGPGFMVGDISKFANTGANFVVGAGTNLSHVFGVNAEFMWHNLPPKDSVIAFTGAPDGHARMYSVTGNLILKTPPSRMGAYWIGGIGWYHRHWELTAPTLSVGTICQPTYVWWGVSCFNGLVETTTTLKDGGVDGFGFNTGGGFTFRLGESPAKFYTELRYHKGYHNLIDTQVLPLTFGIRW